MKITVAESEDRQRIAVGFDGVVAELDGINASWLGQKLMDRARFQVAKASDDPARLAVDELVQG